MRVGVFFNDLPADAGGGYTFEAEVATNLWHVASESHHEFVVFTPHEIVRGQNVPDNLRVSFFPGPRYRRVLNSARNLFRSKSRRVGFLDREANRNSIDMLWFVGAQGLKTDIPYIATVWDLQHRLQPWFPEVGARAIWRHREDFLIEYLQRAALVVTGTDAGAAELRLFYGIPRERVLLIPHPTPTLPEDHQDIPSRMPLPALEEGYLFYPAQLWPHKNHVNLIHALKVLHNRGVRLHLALTGTDKGNQGMVDRTIAEAELVRYVHLLGFVSRPELTFLYKHAVCLVYPSWFGPENLPPLEAFAAQCPVVAARVSGADEQLGDAALLFDPASPESMADAVLQLLHDSQLRDGLVRKGVTRAMERSGRRYLLDVLAALERFECIRRSWMPGGGAAT